ncbi:MAG: hypothetical protein J5585_03170 [Clostridia bacterium]|nr:hypothetical protein [Clostridia bacterium]
MDILRAEHSGVAFTADPANHAFTVVVKGVEWRMTAAPYIEFSDGRKIDFPAPFAVGGVCSGTCDAIKAEYRGFEGSEIHAVAVIKMDRGTGDITFYINITGDEPCEINVVSYPGPFCFGVQPGHGYTVLPRMQGTIYPAGEKPVIETGLIYERDGYMPLFGQVRDGTGYAAIFETPYDCRYTVDGDMIVPLWRTSLGKMNYPRVMRYIFRDECDYNVIAKCYRSYLIERGMLVTLKEKIAKNENVAKLLGCPVIHSGIAFHISPDSMFFDKDHPENNDGYTSFYTRAEQLKRLKKLGLEKAYTHFDGWGKHGYDNLHPSPFPPHEESGGAAGMAYLSDTCRELGYIFGIHDQYRDYYYDNPDFSFDDALTYADGGHPFHDVWNGGKHTFLCSMLAPDYVRRNYDEFERLGVKIDASYLDVFSVVELDECFHPDHTCTRRDCAENRRHCLDILTSRGIIPSSEEVLDCILPSQVLCHHAPFYTEVLGGENSPASGIPIPLLSLVYHDCVVIPWIGLPGERGGWSIPVTDSAYLYGILYGYPVYCPIDADGDDVKAVNAACESAEKLALTEMVKHEFVGDGYRRQRTYFSDGTVIEADLDTCEYTIKN